MKYLSLRRGFAVAGLCAVSFLAAAEPAHSPTFPAPSDWQQGSAKANQLLVKYRNIDLAERPAAAQGLHKVEEQVGLYRPTQVISSAADDIARWRLVTFADGAAAGEAFEALRKNPDVEYVAPNTAYQLAVKPNDLSAELWGLDNTGQRIDGVAGKADADIDAPEGWAIRTDAAEVVVAVIDTGIDYTHPDLAANLWTNPGEIPGNGIDDDGNGYIDDVHGYDFADDDADPMDLNGHGTHVAGTLGAVGNNGRGISGVAWTTQLMAVKIFADGDGNAYASDIINGILYAADMGAQVSNNSWGALWSDSVKAQVLDRPLYEAVAHANQAGMLFVAAAGNNGVSLDERHMSTPSGFRLPNIISVAASDNTDALAAFSNYGQTETDLAAPGVSIRSTLPGNAYGVLSGTSMAAPHVAGAAALLYAQNPDLRAPEARAILMGTSDRLAALTGKVSSGGRLNLHQALSYQHIKACTLHSASPSQHISAGRAVACGNYSLYACAKGSNENLGSRYVSTKITLIEEAPGYFVKGSSCPPQTVDYPPVISLRGEPESYVRLGGSYTPAGYSASDREDGDLTAKVIVASNVDTNVEGSYRVSYTVSDSKGNAAATAYRVVHVRDQDDPPTLVLFGPTVTPVGGSYLATEEGRPVAEPGFAAWDLLEGDLTSKVTHTPLDTSRKNLQWMIYSVEDAAGQTDFGLRMVAVLDKELPHVFFTDGLIGYPLKDLSHARTWLRQPGYGQYFQAPVFVADMQEKSTRTLHWSEDAEADVEREGIHERRVTVTDSDGNSYTGVQTIEVVRSVNPPVVTLNGAEQVRLEVGSAFSDPGFTHSVDLNDFHDHDCSYGSFKTPHFADHLDQEGIYTITYFAENCSGLRTERNRTIEVVRSHWNHKPRVDDWKIRVDTQTRGEAWVSGEAVDVDGDLLRVELSLSEDGANWGAWQTAHGTARFDLTFTRPGRYILKARAVDAAGNISDEAYYGYGGEASWFTVLPGERPPVVNSAQASVNGSRVTISGSASDPDGDLRQLYVIDGPGTIQCQGTSNYVCTLADQPEGTRTLQVVAKDALGLTSAPRPVSFTIAPAGCFTAANSAHASAGRASIKYNVLHYAVGSEDYLGLASASSSLQQQKAGFWKKVASCP